VKGMKNIKLSRKGKIVLGVVTLVIIVMVGYFINQSSSQVSVDYYTVDEGEILQSISSEGKIISEDVSTAFAGANGEVIIFNKEIGDVVEKGDVIAKINKDTILLQIDGVNGQIANVEYMLKEAVKPAEKERINSLEYSIETAKNNLERSKEQVSKMEKLYENQAISLEELDNAKDQKIELENQVKSLQSDLSLLKKTASANVQMQYESQINSLKAEKEQLKNTLNRTDIVADINGVITEKFIKKGSFVTQGSPIVEVTNLDDIKILADVLESELIDIKRGMSVKIDDSRSGKMVMSEVVKIYPKIYSELTELGIQQKKVNVEVDGSQLSKGYILNQVLDLEFIVDERASALRIPLDSYYTDNEEHFVFINNNGVAESKKIDIGLIGEDYVEIEDGLLKGDQIIEVLDNDISEGMSIK
jgi:HlyD family secretion protein